MSDIEAVLSAIPRIQFACRTRTVTDPASGRTLSEHQARLLSHLDETDPTMVTELAEFMGVTPSTMSLNLKRLREAGFISRERDPDDRRVMNVRLTEAGARVRQELEPLDPLGVDRLLRRLRPEDRRLAVRGLILLADAADALVATRRGRAASRGTTGGDP